MHKSLPEAQILPDKTHHGALVHHGNHRFKRAAKQVRPESRERPRLRGVKHHFP
jgi:hypothetical protein